jgi:pimeloyl-ACP methyl ester carboxylesterase
MRFVQRNGVRLYFEEALGAAAPVALIHGWCCDHTYLGPQLRHFAQKGHRVVAVDLRGHGLSDKPRERYTMEGFADDVAFVCNHIGLAKALVIGHSMGGIVAFDLASRYPDIPAAVAMLDAAIVLPQEARDAMPDFLSKLGGPDYKRVMREYVAKSLFIPSDDAPRREKILSAMTSAPQYVAVSSFEALRDYDAAKTAQVTAPSLYIAANEPNRRSDMNRVRALLPNLFFGQTVGSGHFCQLEVPDQVNAMIDRFLAIATAPEGT